VLALRKNNAAAVAKGTKQPLPLCRHVKFRSLAACLPKA